MSTPKPLLRALEARDGHRSAWTGNDDDTLVPQHRVGGMGGSPFKHRLSNVVWLESLINGLIESDPVWADEARRRGFKVSQHERSTEHVPIDHAVHGRCLLLDDGQIITGSAVF
jgi:hypothetical protein